MLRAGHLESVNVDISVSGDSVNHVVTMKFNPATGDFEETSKYNPVALSAIKTNSNW